MPGIETPNLHTAVASRTGLDIRIHLSRRTFAAGRHLSGVLTLNTDKPLDIRSIILRLTGTEIQSAPNLARKMQQPLPFFERELLLSGKENPRHKADKLAQWWGELLGRDTGRRISAGVHSYPFDFALPASLPPSYHGKCGKIEYVIEAEAEFPLGRRVSVADEVSVVFIPRPQRLRPVSMNYPEGSGTLQDSGINIVLELPDRNVMPGTLMHGKFIISNKNGYKIERMRVFLEKVEWIKEPMQKELVRDTVKSVDVNVHEPNAQAIEEEFELEVPSDAALSVEGVAICVMWLLKLKLDTDPPLEFMTPITIYKQPED